MSPCRKPRGNYRRVRITLTIEVTDEERAAIGSFLKRPPSRGVVGETLLAWLRRDLDEAVKNFKNEQRNEPS